MKLFIPGDIGIYPARPGDIAIYRAIYLRGSGPINQYVIVYTLSYTLT